jgi:hypothetical protein
MLMQSKENKKRGPAMHSDVPEDTLLEKDPSQPNNHPELEFLSPAMPSDIPKDTSPEDTSFTESAMLEPVSPKIAGREKPDKEEEALVISAKATVGEKPIFDIKESIQKQVALNKPKTRKYMANIPDDFTLGLFGDSISSGSAKFAPNIPKIARGEKADKEVGALVIPAKATVEEKPVIDNRASLQKRAAHNKPKTGKHRAQPGVAKRKLAKPDVKPKKKQKSKKISEDCLQSKTPPEGEMLVPMKECLDNPVGIPPSTKSKHKSKEPPIASTAPEDHSQLKSPPELGMQGPVEPSQLKSPPELGMQVLVEPSKNPSVDIPPFTETDHESKNPTIASKSQRGTAVSSKIPVALSRQTTSNASCQIKEAVIYRLVCSKTCNKSDPK